MGIAANPARRHVSRTAIPSHRAWWRLGRLTALTIAYVMVLTLLHKAIPPFSDWWIGHNLFALCYPYLLLAVWLGDVWEAKRRAAPVNGTKNQNSKNPTTKFQQADSGFGSWDLVLGTFRYYQNLHFFEPLPA